MCHSHVTYVTVSRNIYDSQKDIMTENNLKVSSKASKFEWALDNIRIDKIILVPIWAITFFLEVSALLDVRNCPSLVQYQGKLLIQSQENGKNPNFAPNLWFSKFFPRVLPLLVVRQCSKLSSCVILRKNNAPNLK